jgi:hypothetical protein
MHPFMLIVPIIVGQCRQIYVYTARIVEKEPSCKVEAFVEGGWEGVTRILPCQELKGFDIAKCPDEEEPE